MMLADNAVETALQGRLVVRLTYNQPLTVSGLAVMLKRFSDLDDALTAPWRPLVMSGHFNGRERGHDVRIGGQP
jgi:hypothetical protein